MLTCRGRGHRWLNWFARDRGHRWLRLLLQTDVQKGPWARATEASKSSTWGRRRTLAPTRSNLRLAAHPSPVPVAQHAQRKLMHVAWAGLYQWPVAGAGCSNHGVHWHVWTRPPRVGNQGIKGYDEDGQQEALRGLSCTGSGVGGRPRWRSHDGAHALYDYSSNSRCHTRKSPNWADLLC